MTVGTILLVLALICFVLAACGVPLGPVSTVALGLAFWVLAVLLGHGGVVR